MNDVFFPFDDRLGIHGVEFFHAGSGSRLIAGHDTLNFCVDLHFGGTETGRLVLRRKIPLSELFCLLQQVNLLGDVGGIDDRKFSIRDENSRGLRLSHRRSHRHHIGVV